MEPGMPLLLSDAARAQIRLRANELDQSGDWPAEDLALLGEAGAFRAAIPRELGTEHSGLAQHLLYEEIARASLAVSLILSQRDAAVGLIVASDSPAKEQLLPRLASGNVFITVGIAQLTTSRQGAEPALRAERIAGGYRLHGLIPWCTGAAKAEQIVVGAVAENGRQVLFLLPSDARGVRLDTPMQLAAMRATWTSSLRCDGVHIDDAMVLKTGDRVLARANQLPLGQTFLAMGLCRAAIDLIGELNSATADRAIARLDSQLALVHTEVMALSQPGSEGPANDAAPAIRGRCGDLALRATHAAVALYKGTGLMAGHPAQRLAREALFLLVWSCPSSVIDCTVDVLTE
jgi:alkylation response protein AidB-like acyl-CoA dehydrogenase